MIQDRQGAIWVAARRGLFKFANNRWTLAGKSDGYNGAEAFSLYEDRAGHLWVGTASGIYKKTKDVFELVDPSVTNVQSLTEDASGNIWVTDAQEVLMRLSTHSTPQHERAIRLPTGAWRVMRDSRGQIWAAAFGGGLMRVRDPLDNDAIIERYEYEHRLAGHLDRCTRIARGTSGSACAAVSSASPKVPSPASHSWRGSPMKACVRRLSAATAVCGSPPVTA
jgi:ligand-binding sensor domain-containing protein